MCVCTGPMAAMETERLTCVGQAALRTVEKEDKNMVTAMCEAVLTLKHPDTAVSTWSVMTTACGQYRLSFSMAEGLSLGSGEYAYLMSVNPWHTADIAVGRTADVLRLVVQMYPQSQPARSVDVHLARISEYLHLGRLDHQPDARPPPTLLALTQGPSGESQESGAASSTWNGASNGVQAQLNAHVRADQVHHGGAAALPVAAPPEMPAPPLREGGGGPYLSGNLETVAAEDRNAVDVCACAVMELRQPRKLVIEWQLAVREGYYVLVFSLNGTVLREWGWRDHLRLVYEMQERCPDAAVTYALRARGGTEDVVAHNKTSLILELVLPMYTSRIVERSLVVSTLVHRDWRGAAGQAPKGQAALVEGGASKKRKHGDGGDGGDEGTAAARNSLRGWSQTPGPGKAPGWPARLLGSLFPGGGSGSLRTEL